MDDGSGRRGKGNVNLGMQLAAMRSISRQWKPDCDEQEADLESEILKRIDEGDATSPLDNAASPMRYSTFQRRKSWRKSAKLGPIR
jgi:hypothetical protein